MTISELETRLSRVTTAAGWAWLQEAKAEVAASPAAVRVRFPAVGRCVGRQALEAAPPGGVLFAWTADTAGRAVLLEPLGDAADRELEGLYRHGAHREAADHGTPTEHLPITRVLTHTALRNPNPLAIIPAGLVNNLNAGLAWGLLPVLFAAEGLIGLRGAVGVVAALTAAGGLVAARLLSETRRRAPSGGHVNEEELRSLAK